MFNTGAAFARGQGFGPVLGVLVAIISVVLLIVAARRTDRLGPVFLGLVIGGAIGNLIDRITRAEDGFLSGAVVDFVDLGWWPVFNVADSAVVVGVLAFVTLAWMTDEDRAGGSGGELDDNADDSEASSDDQQAPVTDHQG